MEFRDYIAIGSLTVTLGGFIFTWAISRGWAQKTAFRDELAKFASDEHATSVFSKDAQEQARRAGAYLSLELAERARRQASKLAKRATLFWPRVIMVGVLAVSVAGVLIVAAFLPREASDVPLGDLLTKVYLLAMAAVLLLAGVGYCLDLQRLRKATPNLRSFFVSVALAKNLNAIDALSIQEQEMVKDVLAAEPVKSGFWSSLRTPKGARKK